VRKGGERTIQTQVQTKNREEKKGLEIYQSKDEKKNGA